MRVRWLFALVLVVSTFVPVGSPAACEHPNPCGDEWPAGLTGPFEMASLDHRPITSQDGTKLDGWIARPRLPEGVRAPVALISSPYFGNCIVVQLGCNRRPDDAVFNNDALEAISVPGYWAEWHEGNVENAGDIRTNSFGFPLIHLVREGYAVALYSVRGTGNSGGCFEMGGRDEQLDQATLVEWLGTQAWSNGRVAMGGLSYGAWTTWQAAVQAPSHLVATVTAGEVTDPYEAYFTPQGARMTDTMWFLPGFDGQLTAHLPSLVGDDPDIRVCEAVRAATRDPGDYANDVRSKSYFDERDLRGRLANVRSAALSSHGFLDRTQHTTQDSLMWEELPNAPKRFIRGWWGHLFPAPAYNNLATTDFTTLNAAWSEPNWESIVMRWLAYWLKGIGDPGRINVMDVHDGSSWLARHDGWSTPLEAMYLGSGALGSTPGGAPATFRDAPHPAETYLFGTPGGYPALCPTDDATKSTYAVYESAPLSEDAEIAGNPFAYLRLSSSLARGMVHVTLWDAAPDIGCNELQQPTGARWLSTGAADLRFYATPFTATPFPAAPTNIRIDLSDTAARIQKGHRLVVVVGAGEAEYFIGRPEDALTDITVGTDGGDHASQILLPIVEGSAGGITPLVSYPPRPTTR